MEILSKENLVGAETAPTAVSRTFRPLSKENQVSLVRIHFSHPESDGKSADVGGGGRIGILNKCIFFLGGVSPPDGEECPTFSFPPLPSNQIF